MNDLFTSVKVSATGQRWVNELSNFNFSIHYKPGTENVVADLLSRYPRPQECNLEQYSHHLNPDEVKSAFDAFVNQVGNNETWFAAVIRINTVFSDIENQILYDVGKKKITLASQDPAKYQAEEKWIQLVIQFKKKGQYPDKQLPRESKIVFREWNNLQVHEDILYRQKQQQSRQLILPSKLKPLVYNELHVNMGHLGIDRTTELIKSRFYWPLMDDDIKYFVTKICPFVRRKNPHIIKAAAMQSISTSEPLEIISMDFLHLDKSSGGYQYLLVVTDLFTKFTQFYVTRNKEGKTAEQRFYNDFILKFGLPRNLLHDQGKEFDNNLFKHLPRFCNIKRIRTSLYHPHINGQTEMMNQTMINMLKTLAERNKANWKDHIHKLLHAYNCTTHSSTGYSPYYLLFGRTPKLFIDLIIPSQAAGHEQATHLSYGDKWEEQMTQVYEITGRQSMRESQKMLSDIMLRD